MAKDLEGAVSFRNVSKRYGDTVAVQQFDLEVEPGEFVTLLGPSGSGKTTALNILAGFTDATEGDVLIGGKSVRGLPPERRNVGMVFQNYALFPHMSVFENVAFPLRLRRLPRPEIRERVDRALAMVKLQDYAQRKPRALSGGERQRVALARAVVFEPPVLLMDESLSSLDLKLREEMRIEIRHLHAQIACTILFVTHDQGEALTLADRIAVMNEGRIVQFDTPETIYDLPATRFVAEFIGQTNLLALTPTGNGKAMLAEEGMPARELAAGPSLAVSLRPEKLRRLGKGAVSKEVIAFDATVDEPLFLGEVVLYNVRLPSGRTLLFKEGRGEGQPPLYKNDTVRLGFRPEDAVPITEDHRNPVH